MVRTERSSLKLLWYQIYHIILWPLYCDSKQFKLLGGSLLAITGFRTENLGEVGWGGLYGEEAIGKFSRSRTQGRKTNGAVAVSKGQVIHGGGAGF